MIPAFLEFFIHIDSYLAPLVQTYGFWIYLILFLIIFIETGLIVFPFLPGDSLLFVAGTLAGTGLLDMLTLCVLLSLAAIAGDSVNYWIGKTSRLERLQERYPKVFKKEHFEATNRYYAKYGGKTIIIARFVPYIRTFAPFLAGVGHMSYPKFLSYNIIGGIAWVVSFLSLGYFFGSIPFVQKHYDLAVLAIVLISIVAVVYILFDAARFTAEERKAKREEKMVPAGEKPDER
jgi:membrane-associated protein